MAALQVTETAYAKVNLCLHVTGQRADGYHLLDSLVVFAPFGDELRVALADKLSLVVTGPESAGVPEDGRNLVAKAVYHHADKCGLDGRLAMYLVKTLPAASGIGGGSADAAAALRGVMQIFETPEMWPDAPIRNGTMEIEAHSDAMKQLARLDLAGLGADVPMCYLSYPARVRGIGDDITRVVLPPLPAVLLNPRVEVSTPAVFKALPQKTNPMLPDLPRFATQRACIDWLAQQRNDLQAPAMELAPAIAATLATLADLPDCQLVRMSGSGATCFALFETQQQAETALQLVRAARPDWWSACGTLGDQSGRPWATASS